MNRQLERTFSLDLKNYEEIIIHNSLRFDLGQRKL